MTTLIGSLDKYSKGGGKSGGSYDKGMYLAMLDSSRCCMSTKDEARRVLEADTYKVVLVSDGWRCSQYLGDREVRRARAGKGFFLGPCCPRGVFLGPGDPCGFVLSGRAGSL